MKKKATREEVGEEAEAENEEEEEEEDEGYKPNEIRIKVRVEKDVPKGSVLLKGARIITMNGDEVIENGDILIEGRKDQRGWHIRQHRSWKSGSDLT